MSTKTVCDKFQIILITGVFMAAGDATAVAFAAVILFAEVFIDL